MPGRSHLTAHIPVPPERVYGLLLDGDAVRRWKVPDGMTGDIHLFDPVENGTFRVSLTYDSPAGQGKSGPHTDTYKGQFVALIPHTRVVEVIEFETEDPAMMGPMTVTYRLEASGDGTDLEVVLEGVPDGIPTADNEFGWRMALDKLAKLAEAEDSDDGW